MMHSFRRAFSTMLMPILLRKPRQQVAALCYRDGKAGREVLLITSRDTGRWIVPKGWPIEGKDGAQSALQEAWEEAGVRKAEIGSDPIGTYFYEKGLDDGDSIPIEAEVYLAQVTKLRDSYPEVDQRERAWFAPQEAANLVDEPELRDILRAL